MKSNKKIKFTYGNAIKNYTSEVKGITLISLVITIIILIILAGVTINLTLGENGLFNTAKEAVNMQKVAEYKDRVEISRATVALNNLGKVTIDKLIEQIHKDGIAEQGKITKISETEAEMITNEGYKFKVTLDGVEYIDKDGEKPPVEEEIPVATGNVIIEAPSWDLNTHKASVTITKGDSISSKFNIQYQVVTRVEELTESGWIQGTEVSNINVNQTVFARLWDGKKGGEYTSLKITEKIEPTITVTITETSTNTITASVTSSDAESGMPVNPIYTFYIKKTNDEDTEYEQKQGNTTPTCTFSGLDQNTSYTIKVTADDLAGNTGIGTKEGTTGTQKVSNITLNKTRLDIKKEETETLTTTIEPINAYNKNVTWSSNNESIATVNSEGVVTGVGEGTTSITVTAMDGSGASAECTVNVTLPPPTVETTESTTHTAKEIQYSWDELGEIAETISNNYPTITNDTAEVAVNINGKDDILGVGDTKKINGRIVRILGFKHDELSDKNAYGDDKEHTYAGISFEYVDFITDELSGFTSYGVWGWERSAARSVLNGKLYDGIKDEVKSIKSVVKACYTSYRFTDIGYTNDYLWLLSGSEIFKDGKNTGWAGYTKNGEGERYKYYKLVLDKSYNQTCIYLLKPSTVDKAELNIDEHTWWLRSIAYMNYSIDSYYACVGSSGTAGGQSYGTQYKEGYGLAPGFAI